MISIVVAVLGVCAAVIIVIYAIHLANKAGWHSGYDDGYVDGFEEGGKEEHGEVIKLIDRMQERKGGDRDGE